MKKVLMMTLLACGHPATGDSKPEIGSSLDTYTDDDTPVLIDWRSYVLDGSKGPEALSLASLSVVDSLGLATDIGDGTFKYDPLQALLYLGKGEARDVQVQLVVADDAGKQSDPFTVTITVRGRDTKPTAPSLSMSGTENAILSVDVPASADVDTKVSDLQAAFSGVSGGSLTFAMGAFIFTPDDSLNALAEGETLHLTFHYTLIGAEGPSPQGTLSVTVVGVNDAPVAADDTALGTVSVDTQINVLMNDHDPDATDVLTITHVDAPATIVGSAIVFPGSAVGMYTFSYTVSDPHGATSSATVSVNIQ